MSKEKENNAFVRICPSCEHEMSYVNIGCRNRANRNNSVCRKCYGLSQTDKTLKENGIEYINGLYLRRCKLCLEKVGYVKKITAFDAERRNACCLSCRPKKVEKTKEKNRGYDNQYNGIHFSVLNNIRRSAKKRNFSASITLEDIYEVFSKQKFKCPFSGIVLSLPSDASDYLNILSYNGSVDRIDSSKGYTKSNIQIVHKYYQLMKMSKTDEDFIELCKIVTYHQEPLQKQIDVIMLRLISDDKLMIEVRQRLKDGMIKNVY